MFETRWLPTIWLATLCIAVRGSPALNYANSTTAAIPRPTASQPSVATPTKGASSTAKGMNPVLASALADLMAKNGDSPEAGMLGAVLAGGRPNGRGPAAPPQMDAAPQFMAAGLRGPFPTIHPPSVPPGATPASFEAVTGKGDASIYACWQSHIEYNQQTYSYFNASGKAVMTIMTLPSSTMETIYSNTSIPTSTFCDGHPRVLGETATPVTLTFTDASMITQKQVFPGPTPACKVQDYQCKDLYSAFESSSFSAISSAYLSYFLDGAPRKKVPNLFFGYVSPPCASVEACPAPSESASCRLDAERATVFYWPSSTAGDLCSRGSFATLTETAAGAAPSTAVFGKVTVTSPSALVIIKSVAASYHPKVTVSPVPEHLPFTHCGSRVNATLQVPPNAVSSMRGSFTPTYVDPGRYTAYKTSSVAYPFNFADMNPGGVPWDAYVAQFGCNLQSKESYACPSTILPTYTPILSLPDGARTIGYDNEFESCSPGKINAATYLPISGTKLEMPSRTIYGAKVSVGPKFSAIKPAALARFVMADATVTPKVVPWAEN